MSKQKGKNERKLTSQRFSEYQKLLTSVQAGLISDGYRVFHVTKGEFIAVGTHVRASVRITLYEVLENGEENDDTSRK